MPSLERHYGELTIDHKDSPGTALVPSGTVLKTKTFNCPHCTREIIKNPKRERERNYCPKCDRYTCDSAGCVVDCNPWQATAELILARPDDPTITLRRTRDGGILFNPELLNKRRVY